MLQQILTSTASTAVSYVASKVTDAVVKRASACYKTEMTDAARRAASDRLRSEYPNRVPVIVQPYDAHQPAIDKRKFLAPVDMTVGQFMYVIRKRISLPPEEALFISVTDSSAIPATAALMGAVHDRYSDRDGHLYISYRLEHAFGAGFP